MGKKWSYSFGERWWRTHYLLTISININSQMMYLDEFVGEKMYQLYISDRPLSGQQLCSTRSARLAQTLKDKWRNIVSTHLYWVLLCKSGVRWWIDPNKYHNCTGILMDRWMDGWISSPIGKHSELHGMMEKSLQPCVLILRSVIHTWFYPMLAFLVEFFSYSVNPSLICLNGTILWSTPAIWNVHYK